MEFSIISEMFEMMEKTTKRIELTNILVELLKKHQKNCPECCVPLTGNY
uniref:Uncharacterized protein n=1 Tax=uncultured marine thaumarchaeote AD1000_16_B05 TaxID=1455894 RepID=A0A075FKD1_9ARCH|nr:hypothetical protein [uncultured marine thaumarchaeote AD1000_16_B05]